jgi:hypothetical protein
MLLTRNISHWEKKHGLRVKGWQCFYKQMDPPKQAGVAVLTADKVDFGWKIFRRDNEGHFILVKVAIHLE